MTAPVAPAPSVRAPRQPGNDGDSTAGAPFASALDGALNAGRDRDVATGSRRSPQSEQRPDPGQRRAGGRDRADRPAHPQTPGTRAHGPGDRGNRRAADHDPDRTPSTPVHDADTTGDPADAVDAGVAAVGAGIPPVWVLPTAPALPSATASDAPVPAAALAGVDAAAAPAPAAGAVAAALPAVAGSPGAQLPDDDAPAVATGDPGPAAPAQPLAQPPGAPADPAGPVLAGPAVRAALAGLPVPPVAGRPSTPSSAPVPPPAATAGTSAPVPVSAPPVLPVGPTPAWARAASATVSAPDATAPSPSAGAPTDGAAALPGLDAVGAPPAPVTGDSASSDPGDTSRQDPGVTSPDPTAAVVAAPAVAPATAVAPVVATTAPAPPAPVAAQVAAQVVTLSQGPDATHSVTLVLHPDNLGPVHVQMTLDQGTVDLTLRGAHEHGRAALLDALPDLRRDLESAGLSCSKLDVDRDTGGSWSSRQQSAQQQAAQQQWADQSRRQPDWSDGRVRPWSRTADSGDSRQIPAPNRSTSRGVDFRV